MPETTAEPATPDYRFFFDAFNASPIGIALENLSGQPFSVNPALCSMLGFTAEELCQKQCVQFSPPEDAEKDWSLFQQLRAGLIDHYQLEKRFFRRDGSLLWGRLSISLFQSRDSTLVVAMVEDITEKRIAQEDLRRSEANLQQVADQLRQRADQLGRLASDLTLAEQHAREQLAKTLHDGLQQLLVSAAMNLDRYLRRAAQREAGPEGTLGRVRGHLDQAIAAARSLSMELSPPALHGSGLPAALTWLAERTRNQYGLVIQVSADPLANSDRKDVRTLLFESVRELVFNAVKHAQVDRITIDLSLAQDDALSITVADRGIGFDPGLVDRGKAGQGGWGLFNIRERLTLLGGRFDIESAPGQGTRFHLVAPRGASQGGVDAERGLSHVATGPALQGAAGFASARALRILLVDDHAVVRGVFRELLQERPELYVMGEAGDGLEAIAKAHALRPDVILMDVSMPRMDGVEATRRIRSELPFIQILGLSIYVKTEDVHPIELAGAAGFFTKGVDTRRLIDHLMAVHAATTLELPSQPA